MAEGSSPLARGLHMRLEKGTVADRIIPARAGFTPGRGTLTRDHRDHPRSRGVYELDPNVSFKMNGSSPLARGLRHSIRRDGRESRIIPARAGFTVSAALAASVCADHPRSRGVYIAFAISILTEAGSSPLARGLPGHGPGARPLPGIIPARAGFTIHGADTLSTRRDHPRSRGVYFRAVADGDPVIGSSPLARGLQVRVNERRSPIGIIPARAGFTGVRRGEPARSQDHPRSRGVYRCMLLLLGPGRGSSPLARGLPS